MRHFLRFFLFVVLPPIFILGVVFIFKPVLCNEFPTWAFLNVLCMAKDSTAAWLQAGGALVAIPIAIYIPVLEQYRHDRIEAERQKDKVRLIGRRVNAGLIELIKELEVKKAKMDGIMPSIEKSESFKREFIVTSNARIDVPPIIEDIWRELDCFDDPIAHTITNALTEIDKLNSNIDKIMKAEIPSVQILPLMKERQKIIIEPINRLKFAHEELVKLLEKLRAPTAIESIRT